MRWVWISLVVVVGTPIVAVAIEPFLHGGEEQGLGADRWEPEHAGAFAANVVVLVLVGPFAEELFFRGLGVRALMVFGGLVAILTTGVIFGLVHGILGALPPLVLFGIGLAWVRLRSAQRVAELHRPRDLQRARHPRCSCSPGPRTRPFADGLSLTHAADRP